MIDQFSKFHFEEDGIVYLKPCFMISLHWVGSIFEQREAILSMYQYAWDAIKKQVKYYGTDSMKRPKKVKKDTGDLVPFWLKDKPGIRAMYILDIDNRETIHSAPDIGMKFYAPEYRGVGGITLFLRVAEVDKSCDALLELATNISMDLSFISGNAGYALNYIRGGEHETLADWSAFPVCFRYPGFEYNCLSNTSFFVHEGLKRVNWLTFLNFDLCDKIGGVKELEKKFSSDIRIHPLSKGIMIQAGPKPEIGDVNRQQNLPLYHEVGRVLAPVRIKNHPEVLIPPDEIMADKEKTQEWLAMFDH